jgi:hypothetical protein
MRILMKGHPFSPLYWKEVHNALVDMVRQVGLPKLFFTIAPWEPSFKYHAWLEDWQYQVGTGDSRTPRRQPVARGAARAPSEAGSRRRVGESSPARHCSQDEMRKCLRTRMHLPVGETLHITNVLMNVVKGFLAGNNQHVSGRQDRQWRRHVFAAKDAKASPTKVIAFTRVEFQDGTRKEGTKRYEGSGRPHLHVLFFSDDLATMRLEDHLFATRPKQDGPLKRYVEQSQKSSFGDADSKWPVRSAPSAYDADSEILRLQHQQRDKEDGLRAYCADVMDALPCHQDWQVSNGEALLLQYVSKYVSKFSDSAYSEWMNDEASADSVARRVCFEYHPYEPEMILQLCGAQFRQYDLSTASGGFRTVCAPWPGMKIVPEWVKSYTKCPWRGERTTLLDWLRKTNDNGDVAHWLQVKYRAVFLEAVYKACCENPNPKMTAFSGTYDDFTKDQLAEQIKSDRRAKPCGLTNEEQYQVRRGRRSHFSTTSEASHSLCALCLVFWPL